jgi:hypothetical protein
MHPNEVLLRESYEAVRGHIFDLYAWDDLWAEIAASSNDG